MAPLTLTATNPALEQILANSPQARAIATVDQSAPTVAPTTKLSSSATFTTLAQTQQVPTGNVLVNNAQLIALGAPSVIAGNQTAVAPAVEAKVNELLGTPTGLAVTAVTPSISDPIPSGFLLTGEAKVFNKLDTQLYQKHDDVLGLQEIAVVQQKGPISIGDFVPSMSGKVPDGIALQDAEFVYNEKDTPLRKAGTWLVADLLLQGSLDSVNNALRNFFHQSSPTIHIEAFLTSAHDWSKPIDTSNLKLVATLPNLNVQVADLLTITEVGLSVQLQRGVPVPPNDIATVLTFGFEGKLNFKSPFGLPAAGIAFSLSETTRDSTKLEIKQSDDAAHFFGLNGLQLASTTFSTEFDITKPVATLAFDVAATMTLNRVILNVTGSYSKDTWNVHTKLDKFNFTSVEAAYNDIFKQNLHTTYAQKISATDLVFNASPKGFVISGNVDVQGHVAAAAKIELNQNGLTVTGSVDNVQLHDKIYLTKAELNVFIGKAADTTVEGAGTSFKFEVTGEISIATKVVQAVLLLDYIGGKSAWTVYASVAGITIGDIEPGLKNSFLDKALLEAAVIASNVDGGVPNNIIPPKFKIVQGLAIAASLPTIRELDLAMGNKTGPATDGLTLEALFTETGFELDIILPTPHVLSFSGGAVTSGPVSLSITVQASGPKPGPAIIIQADVYVKVPTNQQLKFTGGLVATLTEADLFVELKDQYWNNPFGLGSKVALGPDLALSIGITYETATPTLGVVAGIKFGEVAGKGALSISADPTSELFMVELDHLKLSDVVAFLALMTEEKISIPENVLEFDIVKYYLSSGAKIGTIEYPAGASFEAAAQLFGKHASIYVAVDKPSKQITAKGSLDAFEVGPLAVSGTKPGTPATFDVTIGATSQIIKVNGQVDLMGSDVSLLINAVLLPSPNVDLHAKLQFVDHLEFDLDATVVGSVKSIKDLKSLAFAVHVLFKQDIVDYLIGQINTQFVTAKLAVDNGVDSASKTLDAAQKEFEAELDVAQKKVDAARADYETKLNAAKSALAAESAKAGIQRQHLQAALRDANDKLAAAIKAAQDKLQATKNDQANKINSATAAVDKAKRDGDAAVNKALQDLNNAKRDMDSRFGGAVQKVQDAQNTVAGAQRDCDSAQRDVDNAQRDYDNANFLKKAGLLFVLGEKKAVLAAKQGALAAAQGVLNVAKSVIQGPGYAAANAAINSYQVILDAARRTADGAMGAANATLNETKTVAQKAVDAASSTLQVVQTTGQEVVNSRAAQQALDAFENAEKGLLSGLESALDAVGHGVERAAFDTANAGLAVAKANTKDIDAARGALDVAKKAGDAVIQSAQWAAAHGGQLFNVKLFEADAALGDLAGGTAAKGLSVHLVGTFASRNVDVRFAFKPNQGADLAKNMFQKFIADIKAVI